jgi:hypothetical protein
MESSQSRASAGRTCLSVAKVPPDYVVYIPPILGGRPVTVPTSKHLRLRLENLEENMVTFRSDPSKTSCWYSSIVGY